MKLRQLDLKVATALRVPLVCARETHENDQVVIETMYSAPSESFTKKKKLVLYVTKDNRKKKMPRNRMNYVIISFGLVASAGEPQ